MAQKQTIAAEKTVYIQVGGVNVLKVVGGAVIPIGSVDIGSEDSPVINVTSDKMTLSNPDCYLERNDGDLDVYTAADKTLEIQRPAYDDLQFPVSAGKVPAVNNPSFGTFTTNTKEYSFDVNDYIDLAMNEMPHTWTQEEAVEVHLHLAAKSEQVSGTSQYAKFDLYLAVAARAGAYVEQTLTAELEIPNNTGTLSSMYLTMGNLDLTGYDLGAHIKPTIKRIAATSGDEYADEIFVLQAGLHHTKNTLGSRTRLIK